MLDLPRRTARLPDTKTGESVRPLATAACDLLRKLGPGRADALVFPPSRGDGIMSGFPTLFERITKAGGLPKDVTPHILRHSFASLAADLGCSELAIAALLGHRSGSVTARYTHAADDVLLAVADMGVDAAAVGQHRRGLLRDAAPGQQPARLRVLHIHVAELGHRRGRSFCLLLIVGVRALDLGRHQYLLRLGPRRLGRPGRAVRADRVAALSAVLGAVHHEVGDVVADAAPGAKPRHGAGSAIEDGAVRAERADLAEADAVGCDGHVRPLLSLQKSAPNFGVTTG